MVDRKTNNYHLSTMNHPLKIGITGCIGSGKSTVSKIFAQLGIPIYDADTQAKVLMSSSHEIITQIKKIFGEESYHTDGTLNRKHISEIAFHHKDLLQKLNEIVHPAVSNHFVEWCKSFPSKPYIIKEAALMFESDSFKQVNQVIVVSAPEELRITRAMQRDQISRSAVLSRMENQFSEEQKLALADFEIKNNEKELIIPQVLKLHEIFSTNS